MNDRQAIDIRASKRTYIIKTIEPSAVKILENLIHKNNKESDLHLQLYTDNEEAFSGLKMSYGMFKNVRNYVALVGKSDDRNLLEKIGYYGEKFILEATKLGLGTCWVGGTFQRKTCKCDVKEDEKLVGIITFGYVPEKLPMKDNIITTLIHRKSKSMDEMLIANGIIPDWLKKGMEAVMKAPSAVNRQPVSFVYQEGILRAGVVVKYGYELIDLGIAKLHFEIGAGPQNGKWEMGNNVFYQMHVIDRK